MVGVAWVNSKCIRTHFPLGCCANGVVSLALAEMKLLLREVYSRFITLPDPSMTEKMMEMSDQLISSRPLGARCLLRFSPIAKEG